MHADWDDCAKCFRSWDEAGGGRARKARLSPRSPTTRDIAEIGKTLPLINADDTDPDKKMPAANGRERERIPKGKDLPRINADGRGSEEIAKIAGIEKQKRYHEGHERNTKEHKGLK
jgi:hypothetical protein